MIQEGVHLLFKHNVGPTLRQFGQSLRAILLLYTVCHLLPRLHWGREQSMTSG